MRKSDASQSQLPVHSPDSRISSFSLAGVGSDSTAVGKRWLILRSVDKGIDR